MKKCDEQRFVWTAAWMIVVTALIVATGCKKNEQGLIPEPPPKAGSYRTVQVKAFTVLQLIAPVAMSEKGSAATSNKTSLKWELLDAPSPLYRLINDASPQAMFIAAQSGTYTLRVVSEQMADTLQVVVQAADKVPSPYIAKVFDYQPAPGQFVNELPKYEAGDNRERMIAKVAEALIGEDTQLITLGGWGGYVVLGFDHTILNVANRADFRIDGNAFGAVANPRPDAPFGGSCEPGIVLVAYDANKNGLPDEEEWYEIKGSANFSAENELWYPAMQGRSYDLRTLRQYEMTYHQPLDERGNISDYIFWTDNLGQQGYHAKNSFHTQSYYPLWIKDNTLHFSGIRLAQNGIDESGQGNYYVQYAFRYGYVDNYPNTQDAANIDIDWAIDKQGQPVVLPGIDFVKIYNGVHQQNGWLGESSTEVGRGADLHLLKNPTPH